MQLGSVGKFLMVQLHLWKIGTEVWKEVINLVKVTMEDILKSLAKNTKSQEKSYLHTYRTE